MQFLISVIVPVYNSEKYLERCVDSILSQTYSNFEIILIDDGSPDNCPRICDAFAEKDKRVKVFHKENGGASSARNAGIKQARGDYICFVDSDDILCENSLFDLCIAISNKKCQYAAGICGILGSNKVKNHIDSETIIDYKENPEDLLNYITSNGSYSPYSKIYDATIIKKYNIKYDERLKCSEDALFIRQYLSYCSRIVLVPQIVYLYNTNNDSSLSKKYYPDFCFYFTQKMYALEKLVNDLSISDSIKSNFVFDRAVHGLYISIRHYLTHCKNKEQSVALITQSIELLKKWLEINGTSKSHTKWWNTHRDSVEKCNAERIYGVVCKEIKKEKSIYKIKQFIKKLGIRGKNICTSRRHY